MLETPEIHCAPMRLHELDATIAHLAHDPIGHAQLLALARRAQSAIPVRRQLVLAHDAEGPIRGVMFASQQTLLGATDGASAHALARYLPAPPLRYALTGPPLAVDAFLAGGRAKISRSVRRDLPQQIFVLEHLALNPAFFADEVSEAGVRDLEAVVTGTARMIEEELGYDPRRRPAFRREILKQIHARRWWIAQDNELRLLCRVGATTLDTIQLECIWAPPRSRGRGYATRALATICAQLLKRRSVLSLAVNRENARAKRLYERLGFVPYGTQRTVLW
jgi:ribosomal protein S18 acetylase RimI-like enzyme